MTKLSIKTTNNPTIVKFEAAQPFTKGKNYEFKNIDETKNSPLATALFYLPFVKTVYISGNFIAIEKFSIVEWADVQDAVAEQIENYIASGKAVILEETETKKLPITVYGETTPNPSVMKFVCNKRLTKVAVEYKNIDEAKSSPLAAVLFNFPFVKEIFIDENYISITKYNVANWDDVTLELRTFIKEYLENGNTVVDEDKTTTKAISEEAKDVAFDKLDSTSQQIVNIIEEYVKPAVQSDGGNIVFDSFNPENKKVKVILQGACSGCPSSTFTLKNGIENMLKQMLNDEEIVVEALNS
ncbi:NifU family protein [Flavobacterium sp.]|uniref:NifU family protein n=1 Tax=Flavobacterium sp. TaxID=239 RepID=UPI0035283222